MDRKAIEQVVNDLMFSKEAAEYLGVSSQRLNQLVHGGQVKAIKKTPAGSLFLRQDLDERKRNLKTIAPEIAKDKQHQKMDLNTPFMYEVMNYYTIQSFYNYSDKKTEPVFKELSEIMDMQQEFTQIVHKISDALSLDELELQKAYNKVEKGFQSLYKEDMIIKKGMKDYPKLLSLTKEAPPYLFLRGNIHLLKEKIVSVVGSRGASEDGLKKAHRLARHLGNAGIVVASGLARGIDTAAHTAAIENQYPTIAVLGTPITRAYPKENEKLQQVISKDGLVVSQFPPSSQVQRWFFPMRNAVMSGISLATAIVEAGETSGALKQADYALKQKRLVFIPQSALDNENITWPKKYIKREGAAKFSKIEDLFAALEKAKIIPVVEEEQLSLIDEGMEKVYVRQFK
uniref:DNA-processing protein DprA n=1 Tax=uncultured Allobacillus sp. TaxID=1638025 RepID=UPI002598C1F2|nr:DNA-processing protein DprA [uncultured Allobacillus sp.]